MKKTTATTLFVLAQIVLCNLVYAQNALKVDGPSVVEQCDLIRLSVEVAEKEAVIWIVEPPTIDFEQIGKNRIILTMGKEKEARINAIAIKVLEDLTPVPRQVRHVIRVGKVGPKPDPVDPDPVDPDPVDPKPDPDVWSGAETWISEHRIPKSEPAIARQLAAALETAEPQMRGRTLQQSQSIVSQARSNVLLANRGFRAQWNVFFEEFDARVNANPPKTTESYRALVLAMARGLRKAGS